MFFIQWKTNQEFGFTQNKTVIIIIQHIHVQIYHSEA